MFQDENNYDHRQLLGALLATLTRTARSSKEVWLTLTDVCQTIQSVLLCAVETSNERGGVLDLGPCTVDHAVLFLAVAVRE